MSGIAGSYDSSIFNFWVTPILFSKVPIPFNLPTNSPQFSTIVQFSTAAISLHPHQNLPNFVITAIITGMRLHFIVVLICIFFMTILSTFSHSSSNLILNHWPLHCCLVHNSCKPPITGSWHMLLLPSSSFHWPNSTFFIYQLKCCSSYKTSRCQTL